MQEPVTLKLRELNSDREIKILNRTRQINFGRTETRPGSLKKWLWKR